MKHVAWCACAVGLAALAGCVSQAKYDALLAQNEIQSATIKDLERDLDHARTEAEALRGKVQTTREAREAAARLVTTKEEQVALLKARLGDLEVRVRELAARLQPPEVKEVVLPRKVSDALKELAEKEPSLEFDPATGACKFSSDILFDTGDDTVKPEAAEVLRKFAAIFTGVGKDLFLRIEGHTDDRPIAKPATRRRHPTNWHLSVHRAISVLRALAKEGVSPERMSAAGFGKWRPLVPNTSAENRRRNRRVEIYLTYPPAGPAPKPVAAEPTAMGGE